MSRCNRIESMVNPIPSTVFLDFNPQKSPFFACCFFFFKQKTAYEISECDWSSDVCSSDLFFCFKQKTAYEISECDWSSDRKNTRLNSSHIQKSRMPSSA